jgi:hypothetical protein
VNRIDTAVEAVAPYGAVLAALLLVLAWLDVIAL